MHPGLKEAAREGEPFTTDVGTFVVYRVRPIDFPVEIERVEARRLARRQAEAAGYRVVDVLQATYQDDGRWLVELAIDQAPE